MSGNRSKRVEHVILKNERHHKSPSLIEMSNRASTKREKLYLFQNIILHPKTKMSRLLKLLKSILTFAESDRCSILAEFCKTILSKDSIARDKACYFSLDIGIMMQKKVTDSIKIKGKSCAKCGSYQSNDEMI